eukprot:jgi/Mesvir1/20888/Mv07964-RA.2
MGVPSGCAVTAGMRKFAPVVRTRVAPKEGVAGSARPHAHHLHANQAHQQQAHVQLSHQHKHPHQQHLHQQSHQQPHQCPPRQSQSHPRPQEHNGVAASAAVPRAGRPGGAQAPPDVHANGAAGPGRNGHAQDAPRFVGAGNWEKATVHIDDDDDDEVCEMARGEAPAGVAARGSHQEGGATAARPDGLAGHFTHSDRAHRGEDKADGGVNGIGPGHRCGDTGEAQAHPDGFGSAGRSMNGEEGRVDGSSGQRAEGEGGPSVTPPAQGGGVDMCDLILRREEVLCSQERVTADSLEWQQRQEEIKKQALEAQAQKRKRKLEAARTEETERRQEQRLQDLRLRLTQVEAEQSHKDTLRAQVRNRLNMLARCRDLPTLLREMDIPVPLFPTEQQVPGLVCFPGV